MNQWITNYVKGYATCQENKILTYKKKTPLYHITTQEGALPFQQVAMDLVTGLPRHNGKDAILTIVDHGCSRVAVFLPCATTITGPGIAQLYLDNIYRWYGLLNRAVPAQLGPEALALARPERALALNIVRPSQSHFLWPGSGLAWPRPGLLYCMIYEICRAWLMPMQVFFLCHQASPTVQRSPTNFSSS